MGRQYRPNSGLDSPVDTGAADCDHPVTRDEVYVIDTWETLIEKGAPQLVRVRTIITGPARAFRRAERGADSTAGVARQWYEPVPELWAKVCAQFGAEWSATDLAAWERRKRRHDTYDARKRAWEREGWHAYSFERAHGAKTPPGPAPQPVIAEAPESRNFKGWLTADRCTVCGAEFVGPSWHLVSSRRRHFCSNYCEHAYFSRSAFHGRRSRAGLSSARDAAGSDAPLHDVGILVKLGCDTGDW